MEERLTTLLKQLTERSAAPTSSSPLQLAAADLDTISASLLPTAPPRARSLAYLCLSKQAEIAAQRRGPSTSTTTVDSALLATLTKYIQDAVSDTRSEPIIRCLSLMTALFQVDSSLAAAVFNTEGLLDSLIDLVELPFFDNAEEALDVQIATAEVLSAACTVNSLRAFVQARASSWLSGNLSRKDTTVKTDKDRVPDEKVEALKVTSAVALTKLSKAIQADPTIGQQGGGEDSTSEATGAVERPSDLADMLKNMVISQSGKTVEGHHNLANVMAAVEGLAYSSLEAEIKESLCSDRTFLQSLLSLVTSPPSSSTPARTSTLSPSYNLNLDAPRQDDHSAAGIPFGVVTILVNCLSRRPAMSEDQKQMQELRKMASAGLAAGGKKRLGEGAESKDHPLDSDEAVQSRVDRAIQAGAIDAAVAMAKTESVRVKEMDGRLFLALVESQKHRPAVLAKGGGKALLDIVKRLTSGKDDSSSKHPVEGLSSEALPSIQALAKLTITTAPINLFGTNFAQLSLDYIRPLSWLVQHQESSLLQQFEGLMALTNLASFDPSVAARITRQEGLMTEIETKTLDDNVMVRRAAVELICNLMGCDEGFSWYSGDPLPGKDQPAAGANSRLQILLALTDVDDMPTRLAASGALATVTQSPTACRTLLGLEGGPSKAMSRIDDLLNPVRASAGETEEDEDEDIEEVSTLPPDLGLVHRGSVILANILAYAETVGNEEMGKVARTATDSGVTRSLLNLLAVWTSRDSAAQKPSQEVLAAVVECLKMLKNAGVDITKFT